MMATTMPQQTRRTRIARSHGETMTASLKSGDRAASRAENVLRTDDHSIVDFCAPVNQKT
jgi:hypothetical protein